MTDVKLISNQPSGDSAHAEHASAEALASHSKPAQPGSSDVNPTERDYGILAEYVTPSELLRASRIVRDAGYSHWDTYTPFPVHGIDGAMGIRPTRLPWIVLVAGTVGCATAIWLQWYTNAFDYKWIVSGKPFWSVPATIPVTFELTVLFAALSALAAMLIMNNLPLPSHPLDRKPKFLRSTIDRFFLVIQTSDPKFAPDATRELLEETNPTSVEVVPADDSPSALPRPLVFGLVVLTTMALVPLGLAAKARASTSRDPRIHIVPDMDFQLKYKADRLNPFFADQRATRAPVENTVGVADLPLEETFVSGKVNEQFTSALPPVVKVDSELMQRGQERFGIYCAPCHGLSGKGDGMVAKRAEALAEGSWVPPSNLHQEYIRKQPDGQLFNTITKGIRNMAAYGDQIPPQDRWAIVLYVRALQKSQFANVNDIPPDERAALK
ncbi:MAG TPA: quinol:electron acceptor oxidoreductase subunit ActD [Polyangiaceae bacterium]